MVRGLRPLAPLQGGGLVEDLEDQEHPEGHVRVLLVLPAPGLFQREVVVLRTLLLPITMAKIQVLQVMVSILTFYHQVSPLFPLQQGGLVVIFR